MDYRPNSRPFIKCTNTRSPDIGPDEGRGNSPIQPLSEPDVMKRVINQWTPPKHPSYNLIDARLNSFQNWPRSSPSPESLSEAGFFYTGTYIFTKFWFTVFSFQIFVSLTPENFAITGRSDETICFHCEIGIHQWLLTDNAWQEHALWSPFCVYVRYIKGSTFFRESKRLGSSQNQNWQKDVLVWKTMRLIKLG